MENKTSDTDSKSKFDLDKVEIPAPSDDEKEMSSHEPPEQEEQEKTIDTAEPKSTKRTYLILFSLAALSVITLSILWLTNVVRLPGEVQKADSPGFNELYMQIGPVRISSEKAHFSLALTVKCNSPASKEKVAGMDKLIKEKLISFLSTPYTYQIISDRDYNRLKIKLKTILNDALGEKLIEDVYIAEIMLY